MKLITEEEAGVRHGATIMVHGTKVTKGGAAFANSEMAMAGGKLDSFRMLTHPGTSIVPGAFVAAETAGASGRDFLTGLVAGYEVMERLAADFIPTVMARGFHAGPVFGIFGPAVAAAKIMHFTEDQVNSTIALCGTWREATSKGPAAAAAPCARAPRCATPCWRWRWRSRDTWAARPSSKATPASITPMRATTRASSPTALSATPRPAWTRSPPIWGRTGCSSKRSTASTRRPATTSPTSTSRRSSAKSTTSDMRTWIASRPW